MSMTVTTPQVKKTVEDYDVIFSTGIGVTYTIDPAVGDSITIGSETIRISLAPKVSQADPTMLLPAEDVVIFMKHVASIQHRSRIVVELTPEEKADWTKTFQSLVNPSSTVQ